MNYRLLELVAPNDKIDQARDMMEDQSILGVWVDRQEDGCGIMRVLMDADRTETVSDLLSEKFSHVEGFRIMLFSVEATLPQPEIEEEEEEKEDADNENEEPKVGRISREELYSDVTSGSQLSKVYVGMVVLSTVVAGVGLLRDDVAVIIGAMVIAPLLGPNVSMALAATLGDTQLAWRSLKANAAGLFSSLGVALIMGFLLTVDINSEQIISRTQVSLGDITIALAAGSAGVLAFTRGVPAAVVGFGLPGTCRGICHFNLHQPDLHQLGWNIDIPVAGCSSPKLVGSRESQKGDSYSYRHVVRAAGNLCRYDLVLGWELEIYLTKLIILHKVAQRVTE